MSETDSLSSESYLYDEIIKSLEGRLLPKRYRIEKLLWSNASLALFETVYEPEESIVNLLLSRRLIKGEDDYQFVRFSQEVRKLRSMKHINVEKVLDHGLVQEGLPFIIYERIEGPTLEEILVHENRLDAVHVGMIFSQVSKAVQSAHDAGVVHETLKPGRIIVTETKEGDALVKVTGFGLITLCNKLGMGLKQPAAKCSFIGSAAYMSPEQCYEGAETDGRSDIYSIGCMMYETLSGQVPFLASDQMLMKLHVEMEPTPIPVLRKDLKEFPKRLLAIVDKCLLKDPTKRYQYVRDLQSDIERDADPTERDRKTIIPDAIQKAQNRVKESKEPPLKMVTGVLLGLLMAAGICFAGAYIFSQTSKLADAGIWQLKMDAAANAQKEGKYQEASQALSEALTEAQKFKPADIRLAKTQNRIAEYQINCGRYSSALELLKEAAELEEKLSSKEPESNALSYQLMSEAELALANIKDAETHALKAVEQAKLITGERTAAVVASNLQLFYVRLAQNDFKAAQSAIDDMKAAISTTNVKLTMLVISSQKQAEALLLQAQGKLAEAEAALQSVLGDRQESVGLLSLPTLETMTNIGRLYLLQGKKDKAINIFQTVYEAKEKLLGDSNPCLAELSFKLAEMNDSIKNKAEAEKYYRQCLELAEKCWKKGDERTLPYIDALAKFLRAQNSISAAQVYEQEAQEIRHPELTPKLGKH